MMWDMSKQSGDGRKLITLYKEGSDEPIVITTDKDDKIIGYRNHELTEVGNGFLKYSRGIEVMDTPNVRRVGDDFCRIAAVEELSLPHLEQAGDRFCASAKKLKKIDIPMLEEVGDECLEGARVLEEVDSPKLRKTGYRFCASAYKLKHAELPSLVETGDETLDYACALETLSAPKLQKVGDSFARKTELKVMSLPSLEETGEFFADSNEKLEVVDLPKVKKVGDCFLANVQSLKSIRMPSLEKTGDVFLSPHAKEITEFEVPKISKLKWFFSDSRHVVSIINRAKKAQRLMRRDLARLDANAELLPEEIEEAKTVLEDPTVAIDKESKATEDNII